MRRTKRLLYAPGLISLIGLAITLPSFYKKNFPVKKYCLQLFVPNDKPDKNSFNYTFSKYRLEKEINKKEKLKFVFDSNREENKKKTEVIRYEALKLKYTQDTSTVILINFTDSITYGDFVSVLDMCIADDHKRYASWDNKFVIFGEPPIKKVEKSYIGGCILFNDVIVIKQQPVKPNFVELVSKKINQYYTPNGLFLFLGWITLLASFLFFRKRLVKSK